MLQRALAIFLLSMLAAGQVHAQTVDPPPLMNCPTQLEIYLPGDYYFCRGGHRLAKDDPKDALEYFELAAAWGHKKAQYVLGLMHFQGDGTAADHSLGLAWLTLAAERDDREINAAFAYAQQHSSQTEREHAARLLSTMRPVYSDAVTVDRATKRYERETRDLRRASNFASLDPYYVAGLGIGSATNMLDRMDERANLYFKGAQRGTVKVGALDVVDDGDAAAMNKDSPKAETDER